MSTFISVTFFYSEFRKNEYLYSIVLLFLREYQSTVLPPHRRWHPSLLPCCTWGSLLRARLWSQVESRPLGSDPGSSRRPPGNPARSRSKMRTNKAPSQSSLRCDAFLKKKKKTLLDRFQWKKKEKKISLAIKSQIHSLISYPDVLCLRQLRVLCVPDSHGAPPTIYSHFGS